MQPHIQNWIATIIFALKGFDKIKLSTKIKKTNKQSKKS